MADYESLRQYNDFAYRLRDQLNLQQSAEWSGLGVLYKDAEGNILLRSDFLNPTFLEPVICHQSGAVGRAAYDAGGRQGKDQWRNAPLVFRRGGFSAR